jgi:hypothetical protein
MKSNNSNLQKTKLLQNDLPVSKSFLCVATSTQCKLPWWHATHPQDSQFCPTLIVAYRSQLSLCTPDAVFEFLEELTEKLWGYMHMQQNMKWETAL